MSFSPRIWLAAFFLSWFSPVAAQQFTLQGTAAQTGPLSYSLTNDISTQAGMITNTYPLNLAQNFNLRFQLNFGIKDGTGADGFAFLLNNSCTPTLSLGSGLGVNGIKNSLIVEFDTHNNGEALNDITSDHTGIYADGSLTTTGSVIDGQPLPVCLLLNCGNVEDGNWYDVTIQWEYLNAASQRLSVFFNGVLRATSTRNHIGERFSNQPIVFWSVSASTGSLSNLQQFRLSTGNNNILACEGGSVELLAPDLGSNYSWSEGNSTTNSVILPASVSRTVSCTYRDYCGNNRTVLFQIIVNPNPTVTVQTPPPACETQPATVTAVPGTPGAYNYFWTVPAGATSPGDVASFSATRPGTYTVQITGTETGCSSPVAAGSVSFLAAQRPVFQALAPLCIGTTLNPLPGQSVNGIAGSWTPAFNNQATTTYLFVPDPAVCAFADSLTLVINPLPTAGLGPGRSICPGEQLVLDPAVTGNNLSYRWQDGSNGPRFTATQPGTYLVTVTNSCGSATSSVLLEEGRCTVFIPSAFTPNNDGLNDRFRVGGAVVLFDFRMEVFNRWGGLVYSSTDPLAGWDGSRKGQPQPAGLYVYRIRYRLPQNDIPEERNGTMLLIR